MARSKVGALWFLVALIPLATGGVVAVRGGQGLMSGVERMPRVVVPGKADVALERGSYVLYGETRGKHYGPVDVEMSLQLRCAVHDAQGAELALSPTSGSSHYALGGFSGVSMFELSVPEAGTYQLACEGAGGPATIAFGAGLFGGILRIVFGVLGGVFGAILAFGIVYRLRQRARARFEAEQWARRASS